MQRSKTIISLSISFLAIVLGACGTQVEIESKEVSSVGALKDGNANANPDCTTGVVQRSTCVDPGELKYEAYEICLQEGLTLTDLQYQPVCDGWKTDAAQYECCAAPPLPPAPPPPVPPPPGVGCTQGTVGDGQTCQDMGNFKTLSYDACLQAGLMLTNIYDFNFGSCNASEGLSANYECCPVPPPPPPPVVCLTGAIGDGQTCQNLGDFKTLAFEACSQAGLMLFDLTISDTGSCNANDALLAEYKCISQDNVCP